VPTFVLLALWARAVRSILRRVPKVKLADVARAAKVHPGTASRALDPHQRGQVSAETVDRVVRAAQRLGYVPNAQARALRTSRSHLVGIVVPDITNPLFPPIVRGAEHVLTSAGYTVLLTDTDNDRDRERRQIESLLGRGVDGFIIATALWDDPLLTDLAEAGVPVVLTNRSASGGRWPYVAGDDQAGVRLSVQHLVNLGHRSIVHLAGPQNVSTGRERARAFRAATKELGLGTGDARVTVCQSYSEVHGRAAMEKVLASRTPFTAVIAGNDLIALGALDALSDAGYSCPGDVSVVGFNDMPFVDRLQPALTTVRLPLQRMGALAADLLMTELDAEGRQDAPTRTLLGVDLIVRGSTATAKRPRARRRS
jgi:LacI family transcriptional regulator